MLSSNNLKKALKIWKLILRWLRDFLFEKNSDWCIYCDLFAYQIVLLDRHLFFLLQFKLLSFVSGWIAVQIQFMDKVGESFKVRFVPILVLALDYAGSFIQLSSKVIVSESLTLSSILNDKEFIVYVQTAEMWRIFCFLFFYTFFDLKRRLISSITKNSSSVVNYKYELSFW